MGSNIYGAKYLDSTLRTTDKVERANLMNTPNTVGAVYRDYLNALFTKWDSILNEDRKELVSALKTISTSMSVWVGLIAAICTILPVVLGINANMNFKYDLDRMTKITNKKIQNKIRRQKAKLKEIDKKIRDGKKQSNENQINQTLSDLAVHMRVISELQDFDSKDNGTFSKPEFFVQVMDNTVEELKKLRKNLKCKCIDNKDNNIHIGITLMLCMLKRLLVSVECTFTDYELMTLQKLRTKIDNEVTKLIDSLNTIDNKKAIKTTIDYVEKVRDLFNDFIRKSESC